MNIQRIQTGSVSTPAAGKIHRAASDPLVDLVGDDQDDPTVTDPVDATTPGSATPPATTAKKLHPRLAEFADRVESRLSQASQARDLSPRQQAALDQAQTQFHSLIQRLDDAYSANSEIKKRPMGDALSQMMDHLAQVVNHIQSGGPLDASFTSQLESQVDVRG